MPLKIQVIIEGYYPEERIVVGSKIEIGGTIKRFREKGVNVDEFKKIVRKKYGDNADIVNKAKKNRVVTLGVKDIPDSGVRDKGEKLSEKDIMDLMKNKMED